MYLQPVGSDASGGISLNSTVPSCSLQGVPFPCQDPHPSSLPWQSSSLTEMDVQMQIEVQQLLLCVLADQLSYEMETPSLQPSGKGVGEFTGKVIEEKEGPVLLDGVQDNSNMAVSLLPCKWICSSYCPEISGFVHKVFN